MQPEVNATAAGCVDPLAAATVAHFCCPSCNRGAALTLWLLAMPIPFSVAARLPE